MSEFEEEEKSKCRMQAKERGREVVVECGAGSMQAEVERGTAELKMKIFIS
ncbi:hypothetical protein [Oryza sativa Japonica Group]|uniref:Uncharacterized protein n=1 Tax=Oryza sativa subsp. japonica TaxID=39947 RepID=Q5QMZ5_ORYSJ|nr:hypothetical protein [Oryza sativa Japonica Group]